MSFQPLKRPDGYYGQNAKIDSTSLGFEDHGIFTVMLGLDYGGTHQGAGMLCLSHTDKDTHKVVMRPELGDIILGVMKACGVQEWEKVNGKTVVAIFEDDSWSSNPIGIAPLLGGKPFIWKSVFADV